MGTIQSPQQQPPSYPPPKPPQQPPQQPPIGQRLTQIQPQIQQPTKQGKWKVSDVANRENVTVSSIFVTINPNNPSITTEQFRPFIQAITGIAEQLVVFKGGKEKLPAVATDAWSETPKIEYALEVGSQRKLTHAHLLFTMKPYSKYGYVHVNVREIERLGIRFFGTKIYVEARSVGEPMGLYNYLSKTRPSGTYTK